MLTLKNISKIWKEMYGENLRTAYSGFYRKLKNLEKADKDAGYYILTDERGEMFGVHLLDRTEARCKELVENIESFTQTFSEEVKSGLIKTLMTGIYTFSVEFEDREKEFYLSATNIYGDGGFI